MRRGHEAQKKHRERTMPVICAEASWRPIIRVSLGSVCRRPECRDQSRSRRNTPLTLFFLAGGFRCGEVFAFVHSLMEGVRTMPGHWLANGPTAIAQAASEHATAGAVEGLSNRHHASGRSDRIRKALPKPDNAVAWRKGLVFTVARRHLCH